MYVKGLSGRTFLRGISGRQVHRRPRGREQATPGQPIGSTEWLKVSKRGVTEGGNAKGRFQEPELGLESGSVAKLCPS